MRPLSGPGRPGRPPVGGLRAIGTSTGICLIAIGAILRFAVAAVSPLGLNLHAVGVVLILVGVLGLLLWPLARGRPAPGTQEPGTQEPGTQEPGTQEPGTQEPGTQEPGTQEPGTREPGMRAPGMLPPDPLLRRLRPGYRKRRLAQIRRAVAADVAEMQDDGRFVSPDAPAHLEDDL